MSTTVTPTLRAVREFWNAHPCNSDSGAGAGAQYFRAVEQARYTREAHVPEVARFGAYRGRRVLEIGCGMGIDGLQFARAGADYTAIDLSDVSLRLAQDNFRLAGCSGRFLHGNAEQMPFADQSFDHIFAFGSIHHSPRTEDIVQEMLRVLRPGGTICVMVYNRTSINYVIEISLLRRVFRQALRPAFMPALLARVTGLPRPKLERHRELLLGPAGGADWLSRNTDGPDCPLARVYDPREVRELFAAFSELQTFVRHFDRSHWPFVGRLLPAAVARFLGNRWGWHRIVTGHRASAEAAA